MFCTTALDPTKLNKPRQFSRSTAPARVVDNTLWTETPAEKQQRLADEVMGKKRRAENADLADLDPQVEEDANKRRKRDAELQRQVEEYTVRSPSLPFFPTTQKINYFPFQQTLAKTPGLDVDRCARAGRGKAQKGHARGGARRDLGPRARHVPRWQVDGRERSAQDHTGRQGTVRKVWGE